MKQKNKVRSSVTFRIRPDVNKLLSLAKRATSKSEGELINEALLKCGPAVIAEARIEQAAAARELDALLAENAARLPASSAPPA